MRAFLVFCAVLLFSGAALAAPTFPKLTGRVVDNADILSPATEQQLTRKLETLEQQTTRQLVVVTLPSLQGYEIEDYGYQLGRTWGVGQKGEDNGALLIVAPNERKVRIEVGYGLEPVLTDALSSLILQEQVLPRFRAGDMEAGVVAGADAIVEQLALPDDQAKARVAQAAEAQADEGPSLPSIVTLLILFFLFMLVSGAFGGRRRRRSGMAAALPWIILSGMGSGGGHRGGWSGGSFGGGGFSGGGGSFGGGGSSGGW